MPTTDRTDAQAALMVAQSELRARSDRIGALSRSLSLGDAVLGGQWLCLDTSLPQGAWPSMARQTVCDTLRQKLGTDAVIEISPQPRQLRPDDWMVLIEESGSRKRGGPQQHFIPTAVMFRVRDLTRADQLLADLRAATKKTKKTTWKDLDRHGERVRSSQILGAAGSWLHATSVVLCHHAMHQNSRNEEQHNYETAMRWLLQRVAWFVRDSGSGIGHLTFATITRYKRERLAEFLDDTRAAHPELHYLHPEFRLEQAAREELLDLPDRIAGPLHSALEVQEGVAESRYLLEIRNLFYRRCRHGDRSVCAPACVNSYGVKTWPTGHEDLFTAHACRCRSTAAPTARAVGAAGVAGYADVGSGDPVAAGGGRVPRVAESPQVRQPGQTATTPTVRVPSSTTTNPAEPIRTPTKGNAVQPEDDQLVGTVSRLLLLQGKVAESQVLATCVELELEHIDTDWGRERISVTLSLPVDDYAAITPATKDTIGAGWREVFDSSQRVAAGVNFSPTLIAADRDWRTEALSATVPEPTPPAPGEAPF